MDTETNNINELIKLEQLPVIFYQLEKIGAEIDKKLVGIEDLKCTEETVKDLKNRRTEINKLNTLMENRRKEIKTKILEGYNAFNTKYEEEVKSKLLNASEILKNKTDEIDNKRKAIKENNVREFANEYIEKYHLENILSYDRLNINVTLSASEKSLKEQAKDKIEKINGEIELIKSEEYATEILVEFKNTLDYVHAKQAVINRHKMLEEIEKEKNKVQELVVEEEKIEEIVQETEEEIIAPVEVEEPTESELMEVTFTITGKREEIIKIREYIKSLGVKYE